MSKINTGGTAFPTVDEHRQNYGEQGMTLRQYYAAKALAGIMANDELDGKRWDLIAQSCFLAADALINFEEQGK